MSLRVFITGATGFLGRRLVKSLLTENVCLHLLVRDSKSADRLMAEVPSELRPRIKLVHGDLAQPQAFAESLAGMDVVYHLAAAMSGDAQSMYQNTVVPTRHLLEAAAQGQVKRCVLVSSLGVYGTESLDRWGTLDEEVPIDPHPELRDAYTRSKIQQEAVAREVHEQSGLPLVVVRPGVIYGPGRSLLTSRVGVSLGPVLLRMGGNQPLPYTHVENCAEAVKLAGTVAGTDGETFNIVDDNLPTGKQILRLLRNQGERVRSLWVPRPLIEPLSLAYECLVACSRQRLPDILSRYKSAAIWKPLRYSNAKARQNLNWEPRISTEVGLQSTIAG